MPEMTATVPPSTGTPETVSQERTDTPHHKVAIIGSGPAGLTAAIYAARANLEPLVVAGNVPMGQLMITSDVENYPGFPEGIQGPELMQKFRDQAERFGSTILERDATRVDFSARPFGIWVGDVEYRADAVIVATGASALWLGLESEEEFRGSRIMQDRALNHPKINVLWNKEVTEVRGEMTVGSLQLRDTESGAESELAVQGMFVAIGYKPNTELFEGQLDIGPGGYLDVKGETGSNVEGVFIAGDVHDHHYRQAVTAAGDGCKAAIDAERWLASVGETEASTATNW